MILTYSTAYLFDFFSSSWSSLNMNEDLLQDSEVNWQCQKKKIPELMDYAHYESIFIVDKNVVDLQFT